MSLSVRVQNNLLKTATRKLVAQMPNIADQLVRKVALDVVAAVAELAPVDTGRYRAGWRVSLEALAAGEGAESETVSVFGAGDTIGVEVTNPVEYGPYIEYGTSTRPPGNQLALALESVRGRLPVQLLESEIRAAWQGST